MLRITVDLFSGRFNPSWVIIDDRRVTELLYVIAQNREIVHKPGSGFLGLGWRGIQFEMFQDESERDFKLPSVFTITDGHEKRNGKAVEIAAQVIEEMTRYTDIKLPEHAYTPLDKVLQKLLLEALKSYEKKLPKIFRIPKVPLDKRIRVTVNDKDCPDCRYEESRFNPGFWNNDSYVKWSNNCYNYSRNWRTNTFAQPGKAHNCFPYPMACADVTKAALCDGLKKLCECLPDSEYPRRKVALVVGPGYDYHWYRKQIGGFWGHKPGHTDARNVDNSGNLVVDPQTADRGPYTDFCGFFYAGKSVTII